jgi:hypothetical protein
VHDEMWCDGDQVCCELPEVDGGPDAAVDAGGDGGVPCSYECTGPSFCSSHSGTVHDEMDCPGSQVCCDY